MLASKQTLLISAHYMQFPNWKFGKYLLVVLGLLILAHDCSGTLGRGICGDTLSNFGMYTAILQEMLKGKIKGLSKSISGGVRGISGKS